MHALFFLLSIAAAPDFPEIGPLDYLRWLTSAGGVGVAAVVFMLIWNGKIVFKREYDKVIAEAAKAEERHTRELTEEKAESKKWENMALELLQSNKRLAAAGERSVGTAEQAVSALAQNAGPK